MTLRDFSLWLLQLNEFSGLAGVLYFIFFMRSGTTLTKLIFYIVLASISFDVAAYFFIRFVYPNSFILGNSWHILNFLLMTAFFYLVLGKTNRIPLYLGIVYVVLAVISFGFIYSFLEGNPFVTVSSNLFVIALCLVAYRAMLHAPGESLRKSPLFWFLTANFAYSCLTLFYHLFRQYLIFDLRIDTFDFSYLSVINLTANISKNFILFYVLVLIDKGYNLQTFSSKTND